MQRKAEGAWSYKQSRNQHSKLQQQQQLQQLQEKLMAFTLKNDKLAQDVAVEKVLNAQLVAVNNKLQTEKHGLSQSLHDEHAINAKSKEQLHCMQNNLTMQSEALASKEKYLSQVILYTVAN